MVTFGLRTMSPISRWTSLGLIVYILVLMYLQDENV
jgi:hypothetical protein